MGRKATTGKFQTREELITCVQTNRTTCSNSELASLCGVSIPTIYRLLASSNSSTVSKKKKKEAKNGAKQTIVGLWCSCYQKIDEATHTPFQGQIIADLGAYWILKITEGVEVKVNRGACSRTPFER